jgi:CubicO group peptidase (beta-lactamase class C family)
MSVRCRRRRFLAAPLGALSLALVLGGGLHAQDVLDAGDTRSGTLAAGDTIDYTLQVGENFLVYGEVDQVSVDVVVTMVDDEGRAARRWGIVSDGTEIFQGEVPSAGTWTLRIASAGDDEGDFELRLLQLEAKSDNPEELADQMMFSLDRPGGPGGAVRVWRDGRTVFSKSYGLADLTHEIEFRPDTPTNIGSTTKQFTAFAVLLEAERGNLSLDDDLRSHFPELPAFTEDVTVRNLLTHTSGLREFLNLWALTGMDTKSLTSDYLLRTVERQPALQNEPGGEFNYNNTAFGLAARIVERTSGQDFDDYMREHVFEPLGMHDSYVRMTQYDIIPGRSEGYTYGETGWVQPGDLGGAVGAGSIYASVEDLEKWAMNLLEPTVGTPEMVEAMMTEFTLNDGNGSGYGFGLFIDEQRGLARVHHGGADVSHRSMLILYPEIDAGLTVQSNASTYGSQGTAMQLGGAFFSDAMEPEEAAVVAPETDGTFDPDAYDLDDFERVAGVYTLDPNPQVEARFWRDGDVLYTQLTGQPAVELRPSAPSTFRIVVVDATIVFEDGDPATGFTLYQAGQEVHATRVEGDASASEETWAPAAEELAAFEGRYYSDEIETFYTVSLEPSEDDAESSLMLHQLHFGDTPLSAGQVDTFTSGVGFTITFERDRNGQVVAFYIDAARTRDVRAVRVR